MPKLGAAPGPSALVVGTAALRPSVPPPPLPFQAHTPSCCRRSTTAAGLLPAVSSRSVRLGARLCEAPASTTHECATRAAAAQGGVYDSGAAHGWIVTYAPTEQWRAHTRACQGTRAHTHAHKHPHRHACWFAGSRYVTVELTESLGGVSDQKDREIKCDRKNGA